MEKKKEPEQSQPDPWFGYSDKEKELLKIAGDKYRTPEDLRRGIRWIQVGPGQVRPEHHATYVPPRPEPDKRWLIKNGLPVD